MKKLILLLFSTGFLCTSLCAKNIVVKNEAELNIANNVALPGDVIVLQNGVWQNCKMVLSCSGTRELPIIVKAGTKGNVFVKGSSSLRLSGNFITIDGLIFTEGASSKGNVWEFKKGEQVANNCRITNCMITSFNNEKRLDENYWIALFGKNNRVDHCSFIDKTNLGVLLAVILDDGRSRENNHSIDSNYFGVRKPLGSNGGEIIRVGLSQHCTFYSNTIIRNNLFEYCDGETEIISIKSCGNFVRNNIFKECQGAVVLRHGNNNTIEGNLFWGNGKEGTGGVRVINEGNWVVNNFFTNCRGTGFRSPLSLMNGVPNSPAIRYLPVRDAVIANNTFSNCSPIALGVGKDGERTAAPKNVYFFNNLFYTNRDTSLCNILSETDSIYFVNNIISNHFSNPGLPGFKKKNIVTQQSGKFVFPFFKMSKVENNLPGNIQGLEHTRLQKGFPKTIGCYNLEYFKTIFNQSKKMGIQWKAPLAKELKAESTFYNCKDAASLYACLQENKINNYIQLTGPVYEFDKPVVINQNTFIKGQASKITFTSTGKLASLFEIKAGKQLQLKNINTDAKSLTANNFISTDSGGSCVHFSLQISNCKFYNLEGYSFLNAAKNSYADEIVIDRSVFFAVKCSLFNLKDELDYRGLYNAEKISISNCLLNNINGTLLNVTRSGMDESTMGPKLFFTNNKIQNCSAETELVKLTGVQQSSVYNNIFINCNPNKVVVSYSDKVSAVHLQQNNDLQNSGTIITNEFVINLK